MTAHLRIAVAGGTGAVGRHVVAALVAAGHDPVVLARSTGVDLVRGTGVAEAVAGVDAVIDVANVATSGARKSVAFFAAETAALLDAAPPHLVVLSIVGIDRVPFGYYAGKRRQEELVAAGPVPWTVLRATQFHEFAGQLLDRVPGPIAVLPRMRVQPVAAAEVAAELVRLAEGPAQGHAPELAGPQQHDLGDLARAVLRARGSRRRAVVVRLPGAAGRAMVGGGLLPTADGPRGRQTFEDWLAAQGR